jgi:hypothetical protein
MSLASNHDHLFFRNIEKVAGIDRHNPAASVSKLHCGETFLQLICFLPCAKLAARVVTDMLTAGGCKL